MFAKRPDMTQITKDRLLHIFLLLSLMAIFVWSLIKPFNLLSWFLMVLPVLAGVLILTLTCSRFRFTNLAYLLMWIYAVIILVGGHYSYSRMPLFNWIRDAFELSRNHYDRIGHFSQGFVPAIIAREVLIRKSPVQSGKWLFFIVLSFCVALSACWELYEWAMAFVTRTPADAFLAIQGDVWDTQWDMFLALAGAVISLVTLGRLHDKCLQKESLNKNANPA